MLKVSNFDVLKKMSEENLDIRLATSENLIRMNKVKAGTQLTFGVSGDVLGGLYSNQLHCCLLIWDKQQFSRIKNLLDTEIPDA